MSIYTTGTLIYICTSSFSDQKQVATEKKLEHPCRPGQRKEDRPKHLSTIDHLRSITHFTGSAPKPHFSQKPASGDRNLLKTGRVTVMRATTNPVFRRSQGYTPVLFFALFWTLKPGSALRGMYYPTAWCLPVFFRQPLVKISCKISSKIWRHKGERSRSDDGVRRE